ncbi:MAG: hypothetical protein ACO3QM_05805 [Candidatus Nanopelagicaceae bacterium]
MTLGTKLGKAVQQDTLQVRKITVDLGETKFDLRVKVPLKKQIEDINARIFSPSAERTEAIYQRLAGPMLKTMQEGGEDFVKALGESVTVKDDDLIVDGTSLRQVAQIQAMEELKVEEYFHLLVSETEESVNETYDQITEQLPEFVVKEIVSAVQSAISPDYRSIKKN